jgi:hypothetical protein
MLGLYPVSAKPLATSGVTNAYALLANNGSYATAGQSAIILRSKIVSANNGSYATTGQSAVILRSKVVSASNGNYTVTGQSATLLRSKSLLGDFGTYTTTGVPAVITYSSGPTPVVVTDQLLITLRSFTERRRF